MVDNAVGLQHQVIAAVVDLRLQDLKPPIPAYPHPFHDLADEEMLEQRLTVRRAQAVLLSVRHLFSAFGCPGIYARASALCQFPAPAFSSFVPTPARSSWPRRPVKARPVGAPGGCQARDRAATPASFSRLSG